MLGAKSAGAIGLVADRTANNATIAVIASQLHGAAALLRGLLHEVRNVDTQRSTLAHRTPAYRRRAVTRSRLTLEETMTASLAEDAIRTASLALPPPQRAEFKQLVAAELKSLPLGMLGPGSLHRVIATCQKTFLDAGAVAVGPAPKHGKPDAIRARAK